MAPYDRQASSIFASLYQSISNQFRVTLDQVKKNTTKFNNTMGLLWRQYSELASGEEGAKEKKEAKKQQLIATLDFLNKNKELKTVTRLKNQAADAIRMLSKHKVELATDDGYQVDIKNKLDQFNQLRKLIIKQEKAMEKAQQSKEKNIAELRGFLEDAVFSLEEEEVRFRATVIKDFIVSRYSGEIPNNLPWSNSKLLSIAEESMNEGIDIQNVPEFFEETYRSSTPGKK